MMRALKQRFGISARHVAVRARYPWYLRWTIFVFLISVNTGLIWGSFVIGRQFGSPVRIEPLNAMTDVSETSRRLTDENEKLRHTAAAFERNLEVERATASDLAKQVRTVALENAVLKEDIAVFKALMSPPGKDSSINVNRFKVERETLPGEYRYRLLLTQTGQRLRDFQGSVKFIVSLQQDGKKVVMAIPVENDKSQDLNFKFYQRIEGSFKVSPDSVVDSLQVRIFEKGAAEARLTETVNLS
ncbi:MAG: DUF6776 family protein [Burkholderiales bacterium]|nr:hypothetical protein [Pseudomonadota bacterium]